MKAEDEKICRDLVAYIAQPPLSDNERVHTCKRLGSLCGRRGATGSWAKPMNSCGGWATR